MDSGNKNPNLPSNGLPALTNTSLRVLGNLIQLRSDVLKESEPAYWLEKAIDKAINQLWHDALHLCNRALLINSKHRDSIILRSYVSLLCDNFKQCYEDLNLYLSLPPNETIRAYANETIWNVLLESIAAKYDLLRKQENQALVKFDYLVFLIGCSSLWGHKKYQLWSSGLDDYSDYDTIDAFRNFQSQNVILKKWALVFLANAKFCYISGEYEEAFSQHYELLDNKLSQEESPIIDLSKAILLDTGFLPAYFLQLEISMRFYDTPLALKSCHKIFEIETNQRELLKSFYSIHEFMDSYADVSNAVDDFINLYFFIETKLVPLPEFPDLIPICIKELKWRYYYNLGKSNEREGNYKTAIDNYTMAIGANPVCWVGSAYYARYLAHKKLGDQSNAQKDLSQYNEAKAKNNNDASIRIRNIIYPNLKSPTS